MMRRGLKKRVVAVAGSALLALSGCQTPGIDALEPPLEPAPIPQAGPFIAADPVEPPPLPADRSQVLAPRERYVPQELLITLAPGARAAALLGRPELQGYRLLETIPLGERLIAHVRVPDGQSLVTARARLGLLPEVAATELNLLAQAHAVPNDPMYADQWSHRPMFANTEKAWDRLTGVDASKVIVAIVDTGLDLEHEEFGVTVPADRVVGGINVATRRVGQQDIPDEVWRDEYASDTDGHGTLVAGIIGATGNNGKGMAGVSWTCRLMPIMASNYDEDGNFQFPLVSVIRGIRHACTYVDPGGAKVRVINLSLGINTGRVVPLFYDAVAFARSKGILVVASTGNLGVPDVSAPANTPSVLAVGATSHHVHTEFVAHYSNYGARLDMVAPGTSIRVTIPTKDSVVGGRGNPPLKHYAYASGTSEAAPYVSGLAALVFAKYDPNHASLATPEGAMTMVESVRTHLMMSVDDYGTPGWDNSWGYGRINADKALSEATLRTFDETLGRRSPRLP